MDRYQIVKIANEYVVNDSSHDEPEEIARFRSVEAAQAFVVKTTIDLDSTHRWEKVMRRDRPH